MCRSSREVAHSLMMRLQLYFNENSPSLPGPSGCLTCPVAAYRLSSLFWRKAALARPGPVLRGGYRHSSLRTWELAIGAGTDGGRRSGRDRARFAAILATCRE